MGPEAYANSEKRDKRYYEVILESLYIAATGRGDGGVILGEHMNAAIWHVTTLYSLSPPD